MKESSSAAVPLIPDPLSPVPFGTATGRLKTFRQASGMSTSNWSCIAVFVMLSALISQLNCYCHRFVGQSLYGSESGKPRALFGRVETMWGHQIFPGESYGKTDVFTFFSPPAPYDRLFALTASQAAPYP